MWLGGSLERLILICSPLTLPLMPFWCNINRKLASLTLSYPHMNKIEILSKLRQAVQVSGNICLNLMCSNSWFLSLLSRFCFLSEFVVVVNIHETEEAAISQDELVNKTLSRLFGLAKITIQLSALCKARSPGLFMLHFYCPPSSLPSLGWSYGD